MRTVSTINVCIIQRTHAKRQFFPQNPQKQEKYYPKITQQISPNLNFIPHLSIRPRGFIRISKQEDSPSTHNYSALYSAGTGLDCGGRTGGAGPSSLCPMAPGPLSATRRVRTSAAASGDFVGETANTAAVRSVSTTGTEKYIIIGFHKLNLRVKKLLRKLI